MLLQFSKGQDGLGPIRLAFTIRLARIKPHGSRSGSLIPDPMLDTRFRSVRPQLGLLFCLSCGRRVGKQKVVTTSLTRVDEDKTNINTQRPQKTGFFVPACEGGVGQEWHIPRFRSSMRPVGPYSYGAIDGFPSRMLAALVSRIPFAAKVWSR